MAGILLVLCGAADNGRGNRVLFPQPPGVTVAITAFYTRRTRDGPVSLSRVDCDDNNTVTATLTGNTVLGGGHGLYIRGGEANYTDDNGMEVTTAMANGNTVTATLTNNRLEGAMYSELQIAAGGAGSASDNTVEITAENNIVCGSEDSLWGPAGVPNDENPSWANRGQATP